MSEEFQGRADVCVVGAGVIGLATAWRLAAAGACVQVFERARPSACASRGAGGMLAPASEVLAEPSTDDALLAAGLESLSLWREFAAQLTASSQMSIDFEVTGATAPAFDGATVQALRDAARRLEAAGVRCAWREAETARRGACMLAPDLEGALTLSEEAQVHAGKLMAALEQACVKAGARILAPTRVVGVQPGTAPEVLVRDKTGESRHSSGAVVIATGWRAREVYDAPVLRHVTPIKGQIALMRLAGGCRAFGPFVRAADVYVAPLSDGVVLAGATMEPGRIDAAPDLAADARLRAAARRVVPMLADAEDSGAWAGVRAGSPDRAPFVGEVAQNVFAAAGHHRNGLLLAPLTAEILEQALVGERRAFADRFSPDRALGLTEA